LQNRIKEIWWPATRSLGEGWCGSLGNFRTSEPAAFESLVEKIDAFNQKFEVL